VTREYGLKFAPFLAVSTESNLRAVTLTLPYAGAIRIRFEGLPVCLQALSLPMADTPSINECLTEGLGQVKLAPTRKSADDRLVLKTDTGVPHDFTHMRDLAGVVVLKKTSPLRAEGVDGKEQHRCRHDAAHADVLFLHGIEQSLRI